MSEPIVLRFSRRMDRNTFSKVGVLHNAGNNRKRQVEELLNEARLHVGMIIEYIIFDTFSSISYCDTDYSAIQIFDDSTFRRLAIRREALLILWCCRCPILDGSVAIRSEPTILKFYLPDTSWCKREPAPPVDSCLAFESG